MTAAQVVCFKSCYNHILQLLKMMNKKIYDSLHGNNRIELTLFRCSDFFLLCDCFSCLEGEHPSCHLFLRGLLLRPCVRVNVFVTASSDVELTESRQSRVSTCNFTVAVSCNVVEVFCWLSLGQRFVGDWWEVGAEKVNESPLGRRRHVSPFSLLSFILIGLIFCPNLFTLLTLVTFTTGLMIFFIIFGGAFLFLAASDVELAVALLGLDSRCTLLLASEVLCGPREALHLRRRLDLGVLEVLQLLALSLTR